jgi:hypothetical protein
VLQDEWEFNRRAGWKDSDDDLPACMKEEGVGPAKVVFDVSREIIAAAKVRQPAAEDLFTARASG